MPQLVVAAAVAGLAAGGTTITAAGIALGFSITAAAATLVVGAASQLLAKKQKPATLGSFDSSRTLTVREPIAPREIVYGRVVKGGTLVFAHTTPALGISGFGEDAVVPANAPHTITVREAANWRGTISVQSVEYVNDNPVFTNFTEVVGAPGLDQYSVIAGVYTFNSGNAGENVTIRYNAEIVTVADNIMHLIVALAGHEVHQLGAVYFDGEEVPLSGTEATGRWAGFVSVRKYTGTSSQTADGVIAAADPVTWTVAHRLQGIAYLAVRLVGSSTLFPNGIPNITCEVYGKKVYDPRSATTAYSANAALCLADYLTDTRLGLGADYATEVDEDSLMDAANICDESVTLAAGGTEARYTCNGVVDTSEAHERTVAALATAMSTQARVVYSGGRWVILPGAYRTPVAALDEDDARGAIKVLPALGRAEAFNAVKGVYVSEANSWQPADFPPVTNSTYQAQDNGERLWSDIELPYTTSAAAAQRIARLHLEAARQEIRVVYPAGLEAMKLRAGDTVTVTNSRLGWASKVFEVEKWSFALREDAAGVPVLGVDLELRETAAGVYTWASSDETTVDVAPNTNLPNPLVVQRPGAPVIAEELFEGRSGVVARARVTWSPAPDQLVTEYEVQYRGIAATQWIALPRVRAETTLLAVTDELQSGGYQFRVRAFNALGSASLWNQTEKEITGLLARPADIAGLTIQRLGGLAILRWTLTADLDVRIGGNIVFRHSPSLSGAAWEASTTIGEAQPGNSIIAVLPLKAGTYLVKAKDSSGLYSETAATVTTKQATVLAYGNLSTLQEDDDFLGDFDGTVTIDGILKLAGTTLIDDVTDIDALADLDAAGAVGLAGTYGFAGNLDLSSVSRVRLTSEILATTVNTNSPIDSRTELIDTWLDFDGVIGGEADAWVEVRETDDDPAGSPVSWSAWQRLDAGEFEARAFEFRARLTSVDPAYNIHVFQLRVHKETVT